MNWRRIDYAATATLTYLRRLLVCAALGSVVVVAWYSVPVLKEGRISVKAVGATAADVGATVKAAGALVANTDHNLNAEPFGFLAEAKVAARHVNTMAEEGARTTIAERKRFAAQADKIDKILDDADALVLSAKGNLNTLTGDMGEVTKALTAALGGIPPTLDEAKATIAAARELISDPEIKAAILSWAATSHSVEQTSAFVAKIAEDAAGKFHRTVNPTTKDKIIGGFKIGLRFLLLYLEKL